MSDPVSRHDQKNALLFLEVFPDLLQTVLRSGEGPGSPEFEDLMAVLREKVALLKKGLDR